jgi:hypothetical protein
MADRKKRSKPVKNLGNMKMQACYIGEFQNGVFHGKGMYYDLKNPFYCGSFINGAKEGLGIETYHNHQSFGMFKQGKL